MAIGGEKARSPLKSKQMNAASRSISEKSSCCLSPSLLVTFDISPENSGHPVIVACELIWGVPSIQLNINFLVHMLAIEHVMLLLLTPINSQTVLCVRIQGVVLLMLWRDRYHLKNHQVHS